MTRIETALQLAEELRQLFAADGARVSVGIHNASAALLDEAAAAGGERRPASSDGYEWEVVTLDHAAHMFSLFGEHRRAPAEDAPLNGDLRGEP